MDCKIRQKTKSIHFITSILSSYWALKMLWVKEIKKFETALQTLKLTLIQATLTI